MITETLTNAGTLAMIFFVLFMIWSLFWKGWALWVSARNGNKKWFIALLILNTLGILEILYIFYFSRKKGEDNKEEEKVLEVEIERG